MSIYDGNAQSMSCKCVNGEFVAMRLWIVLAALSISTPVFAQTLGSTSGASAAINVTNPAATTSTNRLITPPTVVAPGLAAAGIETCLGSSSGGLSLMGGGLTFGSTKVDDGCTIRLLARQLHAFGFPKAALALMCQDERVALAMEAAGALCPSIVPGSHRQISLTSDIATRAEASSSMGTPITRAEQAWFARTSN
jgi:hypothetical protein